MANKGLPTDVIASLDAPLANLKSFLSNYVAVAANVVAASVLPDGRAYVVVSGENDLKVAEAARDYTVAALTAAGIASTFFQIGRRATDRFPFFRVTSSVGILEVLDFKST